MISALLKPEMASVNCTYQTQLENIGWQGFKNNGEMSGTAGKSLRLEAIQIKLTGTDAENYDVYYQVYTEKFGWFDWAKNGESSRFRRVFLPT